ncbi:hypothetical protein A0128_05790 [Leptospira tipperaryensis]|uniref:Uncharacterized protein n=1 Tax=Leptospira tipperaryensis TaxID=2564040 RepID=A0A1D7UUW6_9LEPT|nr:hypothetical protein A0128_05790 [Leptospira tipperaryensis]
MSEQIGGFNFRNLRRSLSKNPSFIRIHFGFENPNSKIKSIVGKEVEGETETFPSFKKVE